jgi:hypothetical protein
VRYLGCVLLLASALALAAGASSDCRAPVLTVEMSSASPKQGGLVAVTVKSDVPLASAAVSSGGRESAMERDGEGRLFLALVGVDFESAVGPREMDVAKASAAIGTRSTARCASSRASFRSRSSGSLPRTSSRPKASSIESGRKRRRSAASG